MFLKPKSTHLNNLAILYKRYLDLSNYLVGDNTTIYKTTENNGFKYWLFDKEQFKFIHYEGSVNDFSSFINITNNTTLVCFSVDENTKYYYRYNNSNHSWTLTTLGAGDSVITGVSNDIGKGQSSSFVRVDEFDYTILGDINIGEEQVIKGLLTDLITFDIRFSQDVDISDNDIVQIDSDLYMVSNIQVKILRCPKALKYYTCSLTKLHI